MKNTALRVVNLLLYLTGCVMVGTGFLMAWRIPPGSRGGHGIEALGLGRHDWGDIHLFTGLAVIALTIAHLALNTAWLRIIAARRKRWPLAAGLGLGLVIILAITFLPLTHREERGGRGERAALRPDHR